MSQYAGPFWIATTVIFLVFVTNTIAQSIQAYMGSQPFVYDFTKLTGAASSLYIFISLVPTSMWGIMK